MTPLYVPEVSFVVESNVHSTEMEVVTVVVVVVDASVVVAAKEDGMKRD